MSPEEKKRLEREEREKLLHSDGQLASSTAPHYESAEEEKKRLEREERERILREGGGGGGAQNQPKEDDGELPPYQEL